MNIDPHASDSYILSFCNKSIYIERERYYLAPPFVSIIFHLLSIISPSLANNHPHLTLWPLLVAMLWLIVKVGLFNKSTVHGQN